MQKVGKNLINSSGEVIFTLGKNKHVCFGDIPYYYYPVDPKPAPIQYSRCLKRRILDLADGRQKDTLLEVLRFV